jgi:hypothetical protein
MWNLSCRCCHTSHRAVLFVWWVYKLSNTEINKWYCNGVLMGAMNVCSFEQVSYWNFAEEVEHFQICFLLIKVRKYSNFYVCMVNVFLKNAIRAWKTNVIEKLIFVTLNLQIINCYRYIFTQNICIHLYLQLCYILREITSSALCCHYLAACHWPCNQWLINYCHQTKS